MWAKVFWTSTKLNLWMRSWELTDAGKQEGAFTDVIWHLEKRLSRSIRNSNPCLSIGSRVSMAIGVNICIMTADCIYFVVCRFLSAAASAAPGHQACQMWPDDVTESEYQWRSRPTLRICYSVMRLMPDRRVFAHNTLVLHRFDCNRLC